MKSLRGLLEGLLQAEQLSSNQQQLTAFARLQPLMDRLSRPRQRSLLRFWRPHGAAERSGAYIYGSVGSGKTMLMDLFYKECPSEKLRLHFTEFMLHVHTRTHELREAGLSGDRLISSVAYELAQKHRLLCLDELQVVDIADAMILRRLFEALFSADTALLITSNRPPKDLYLNGLQRASFLPCIDLIERRLDVINLDAGQDYRRTGGRAADLLFDARTPGSRRRVEALFGELTGGAAPASRTVNVMGRPITARRTAGGVAFFDFAELFLEPLSSVDYLALAREFGTFFVAGVPAFASMSMRPEARRFMTFIDVIYDSRRRLVLEAEVPIEQLFELAQAGPATADRELVDSLGGPGAASLFTGEEERFAAARTVSRLHQILQWRVWWLPAK